MTNKKEEVIANETIFFLGSAHAVSNDSLYQSELKFSSATPWHMSTPQKAKLSLELLSIRETRPFAVYIEF